MALWVKIKFEFDKPLSHPSAFESIKARMCLEDYDFPKNLENFDNEFTWRQPTAEVDLLATYAEAYGASGKLYVGETHWEDKRWYVGYPITFGLAPEEVVNRTNNPPEVCDEWIYDYKRILECLNNGSVWCPSDGVNMELLAILKRGPLHPDELTYITRKMYEDAER